MTEFNYATTKCPGPFDMCQGPQCGIFVRDAGKCSVLVLAEVALKPTKKKPTKETPTK